VAISLTELSSPPFSQLGLAYQSCADLPSKHGDWLVRELGTSFTVGNMNGYIASRDVDFLTWLMMVREFQGDVFGVSFAPLNILHIVLYSAIASKTLSFVA
jgi:hypothetical protein